MHDIKLIRENPAEFDRRLMRRNPEFRGTAQRIIALDERRKAIIRVLEGWRATRKSVSEDIRKAMSSGDEAEVTALREKANLAKESIPTLEREEREIDEQIRNALSEIPNLPLDAPEVPDGTDEHGNVEHHKFGTPKTFAFKPKQHFELGEALGLMDFETAAKLSGARFVVLKGGLARLERALGQFMLDVHTGEHGYTEVNPPLLVNDNTMFGTAQLPKFAEDQFETKIRRFVTSDFETRSGVRSMLEAADGIDFARPDIQAEYVSARERYPSANTSITFVGAFYRSSLGPILSVEERMWLIPTAEVSLTNLVRESIIDESQLPMRLTACTPCFRAEAGAAGKDTRGMIRQHQFTKVELVSITTPEQAMDEHERMTSSAEEILRRLELPYRVMTLCTGDMGFASQKTYDIEVWLPGQDTYREISSCSVCGDFQARRMNARYRGKGGSPRFVTTLNGSGVAVGRALIAVMENYQNEDGSITVPDVLQGYMGGMKRIEKAK
jgi:seryl-tRNA synthetase